MHELSIWLDAAGARLFATCAVLFLALNGGAAATFLLKRDRGLVNRWTARWLAANLALLGAGLGVPLVAKVVRATVDAVSLRPSVVVPQERESAAQEIAPPR